MIVMLLEQKEMHVVKIPSLEPVCANAISGEKVVTRVLLATTVRTAKSASALGLACMTVVVTRTAGVVCAGMGLKANSVRNALQATSITLFVSCVAAAPSARYHKAVIQMAVASANQSMKGPGVSSALRDITHILTVKLVPVILRAPSIITAPRPVTASVAPIIQD